jgi:hypothetical protein
MGHLVEIHNTTLRVNDFRPKGRHVSRSRMGQQSPKRLYTCTWEICDAGETKNRWCPNPTHTSQ